MFFLLGLELKVGWISNIEHDMAHVSYNPK